MGRKNIFLSLIRSIIIVVITELRTHAKPQESTRVLMRFLLTIYRKIEPLGKIKFELSLYLLAQS